MSDSQLIIIGTIIIPVLIAFVGGIWAILKRIDKKANEAETKEKYHELKEDVDSRFRELRQEAKFDHDSQERKLNSQSEEDARIRERMAKLEEVDRQQEVRLESQNNDIKDLKKEMQQGFKEIHNKIDSLILSINSWHTKKSKLD